MPQNQIRQRILYEAYVNGINSNSGKLFERLKLNKQTVDYALEKLKEEELFTKTKYEIDLNAIGIGKFAWVFLSINWETYDHDTFVKKLLGMTQVMLVANVTGTSDIAVKIFGPSINNISSFILMIEKTFSSTINDTVVYFANKEYKRHYLKVEKKKLCKITDADIAILKEKTLNPQTPLGEIAEKYLLHRNTISKRLEKLWEGGVLVKELPDLTQKGYEELHMGLKVFILIKPCPGKEEKIIGVLMKNPEIQDIFTTLSNEIVIVLRTENSSTLAMAHRMLSRINFCVKKTNTSVFLTKHNKTSLSLGEIQGLIQRRNL